MINNLNILDILFLAFVLSLSFIDFTSRNMKNRNFRIIIVGASFLYMFASSVSIGDSHTFSEFSLNIKTINIFVLACMISILLSVYHKFSSNYSRSEETEEILSALSYLPLIEELVESNNKLTLRIEQMEKSHRDGMANIDVRLRDSVISSLTLFNEELTESLNSIVKNFNTNMREGFGDNFAKFDDSIVNLIEWQQEYKTQITKTQEILSMYLNSLGDSSKVLREIGEENKNIVVYHRELADTFKVYSSNVELLNNQLKTFEEISTSSVELLPNIKHSMETLLADMSKTFEEINGNILEIKESFLSNMKEVRIETKHSMDELNFLFKDYTSTINETFAYTQENIDSKLNVSLESFSLLISKISLDVESNLKGINQNFSELIKNMEEKNGVYMRNMNNILSDTSKYIKDNSDNIDGIYKENLINFANTMDSYKKQLADFVKELFSDVSNVVGEIGDINKNAIKESSLNIEKYIKENTDLYIENINKNINETIEKNRELTESSIVSMESSYQKINSLNKDFLEEVKIIRSEMAKLDEEIKDSALINIEESKEFRKNIRMEIDDLDLNMSKIVNQFAQDYEWFLKRIRDIMGKRN